MNRIAQDTLQRKIASVDLLALVERNTGPLKKVASTNGGEYGHVPCPSCGGEDRFYVQPHHPDGKGRFYCRQCTPDGGDAIAYVQLMDGLTFPQALAALGIKANGSQNGKPSNGSKPKRKKAGPVVAEYIYEDKDGEPAFRATRHDPKSFLQWRTDGNGGWLGGLDGMTPPLYHLPEVVEAVERGEQVYIVEGEKSCDALRDKGLAATTNPMGAKKWQEPHSATLKGASVTIIADADSDGRVHVNQVASMLHGTGKSLKVIHLPSLKDGQDVVDWLAAGHKVKDLYALEKTTPEWEPVLDLNLDWLTPDQVKALPPIEYLIDGILPKRGLSVLFGPSETGKSFKALDWASTIAQNDTVLYIAAEGQGGYGKRITAWERHNHKSAGKLRQHHDAINLLDETAIGALCQDGKALKPALIIFDTLALCMAGGEENSAKDMGVVIAACKRIQRETGAAVLLIHHSDKAGRWERGSSALRGAADSMVELSEANGLIKMECSKSKDAEPFKTQQFKIIPVLETDSCVLIPSDQVAHVEDRDLTQAEEKAIDIMAMAAFVDVGIRATILSEQAHFARATGYRVLSDLIELGLVKQHEKGDPHYLTEAGKEAAKGRET